ncbi:MAG: outer membrane beta-barrel protein [Gemmatimonadota bacterium]
MKRNGVLITTAVALLFATADAADAQRDRYRGDTPGVTFELFGGGADFGRFLEQVAVAELDVIDDMAVIGQRFERELTAETSFTFGGTIGVWPWEETGLRLGLTWAPTDLEFDDDTPLADDDFLDQDDLAELGVFTLSLDVLRYLIDPREHRVAPYANAGLVGTWWDLDTGEDIEGILANDDGQYRWGGVGGVGLEVAIARSWSARAEVSTFALGNPFDDDDAYDTANPAFLTFDEPNSVRMTRFTLGLTYSILRERPLFGAR